MPRLKLLAQMKYKYSIQGRKNNVHFSAAVEVFAYIALNG